MSLEGYNGNSSRYQTPHSSALKDIYADYGNTTSVTDQYKNRLKESESILRNLQKHSKVVSTVEADSTPISDTTFRDCQVFLSAMLQRAPLPDIDWEDDTGYLNLCWRLSKQKIISVLLRGDSHAIYSGVSDGGQVNEGILDIRIASGIIISIYHGYLVDLSGREEVTPERSH